MTLSIMKLSITKLSITTISIKGLYVTLGVLAYWVISYVMKKSSVVNTTPEALVSVTHLQLDVVFSF